MNNFLKKMKLIDHLTIDLEIQKKEFVSKFKEQVDEGNINVFSDALDIFSSSKNEYKGQVGHGKFKIKRKKKFFDMNPNIAVAKGTYKQNNENLIIEVEVNGFSPIMIPFYLFVIVFYLFCLLVSLTSTDFDIISIALLLPFICIHAAFMLGIPYLVMKRSTKRMKQELEREFYYMTKK